MKAKGVIKPSRRKLNLKSQKAVLEILENYPENGYEPSEHRMVKIQYPEGLTKNHQVRDVNHLIEQISSFMKNRFGVKSFEFENIPKTLKIGNKIKLKGIKNA